MRRNYRLIIKIVFATIGTVAGICACVVFAKKYHNAPAAAWAGISAIFALLFLHIVFSVWRDIQRRITPTRFLAYMIIGGIGMLAGLSVFIAYLVLGGTGKEDIDGRGSYVVVVWGFMTFKWSLFSFMAARSYYKDYKSQENTMIINE